MGKSQVTSGAKIKMLFYNLYKQFLNFNACSDYTDADIEKAILVHEGD
jgi:vacuolar protein sorting-associated protein 1